MKNDIYLNTIKKSVRDIQDILPSRVLLVAAAKTRLPNEVKAKIPNVEMRFLSMGMSNRNDNKKETDINNQPT